ncbi:MAG: amino acid ABC transporter permease [Burkholderiaceae bacterium]
MFSSERLRGIAFQAILLAAIAGLAWYLIGNTLENLQNRQIQVGFDFLGKEAGFEIGEKPIDYDPTRSYGRAFLVGLINTLIVAGIGIVFATVIGTLLGIGRLSSNWLIARLSTTYVEVLRNVPLLLQLFVWHGLFTELLPGVRQAIRIDDLAVLSQRGFQFAWPIAHAGWRTAGWALLAGIVASIAWRTLAHRHQERTGAQWPVGWITLALVVGLPLLAWAALGAPTGLEKPVLRGFGYRGGVSVSPEFMALLIGLSTYTAAFIAEVVRAGLLAVDRGQHEAGMSLGLGPSQRLRLITLPQALRVIVPPMTSQYLNLTKNSSLAVAIGYPDLVSIANTSMNQTGQAIEAIAILMAVYLTISLLISLGMNLYNARVRLKER